MAEQNPLLTPPREARASELQSAARLPQVSVMIDRISRTMSCKSQTAIEWLTPLAVCTFTDDNPLEGPNDQKGKYGEQQHESPRQARFHFALCLQSIWKGILINIQPRTTLEEVGDLLSDTERNLFCLCTATLQRIQSKSYFGHYG